MVRKVWFKNHWFHVEYEGLHLLCKTCGLYGQWHKDWPKLKKGDMLVVGQPI